MKLIIAEKPSVAKTIADTVKANNRNDGFYTNDNYIISWCVGHLIGLDEASSYDEKYTKWELKYLPILPKNWNTKILPGTKNQFYILKKLMEDNRVDEIICATDAGREGELIFRLVYNKINCNKKVKRLWISSLEESAIQNGLNALKDSFYYDNLYKSAFARAKADWLIGINFTRYYSLIYNAKLNVGRVQTPTLAIINERDYEINNFISKPFYQVALLISGIEAKSDKYDAREQAEKVMQDLIQNTIKCISVKKENKKTKAPKLYDLTTLQREANRYFGYTAQQTLDYLQELYEMKLVSYPRTDSKYITEDMADTVFKLINHNDCNVKQIIDNNKVTDHHGLTPTITSINYDKSSLSIGQKNIYELVNMRLQTSVASDYEELQTKYIFESNGNEFTATDKIVVKSGFKSIENKFKNKNNIKDENIPGENDKNIIQENELYDIDNKEIKEGKTTPPKHFTEDTLLSAMERAGVEEIDKSLDVEKKGLGTPATRASIIEKLIQTDFIKRDKKNLLITEKGIKLIELLPEQLKSPKLTAEWENKLTLICNGNYTDERFLNEIEELVNSLIDVNAEVNNSEFKSEKTNKEVIGKCPRCQSDVFESNVNFYCSNRDCQFTMFKKDKFFTNKKKTITKTIAKELLKNGKVKIKNLFSEKTQKTYSATVLINDTGEYVNYKLEFEKPRR